MRRTVTALVTLLLVVLAGFLVGTGGEDSSPSGTSAPSTSSARDDGTIAEADLPVEARETLALIDAGGPFPYDEDGSTFENREGLLPPEARGWYAEYTVETPGEDDRGPRRLVVGDDGTCWWTVDHYASFVEVDRGS